MDPLKVVTVKCEQSTMNDQFIKTIKLLKLHKVIPTITDVNNGLVSENTEICNKFNNYFTNVGPSMDAKIPNTYLKKFNTTNIMKSSCYDPVSPEEVLFQLQQLDSSKVSGRENIPNIFYKLLAPIISPLLSEIVNGCYEKGDFSFILKHAKVIPIHKSGLKDIVSNYRPISILSTVSNIIEKLLYFRLDSFLPLTNSSHSNNLDFVKDIQLKWP